ncbi:PhzF family phenazine biosynthesis protein [Pseudoclavibacter terrae]|uniref:PhzF family phenazine biosynthesis protein n=1 Tax=Pseudoclavibacter terrae TaxID=1530195 RepID=A0A7J5B5D5_9MICO|nr:PhzF family phenazine biosynthesis isomerase [Pseudoclavibacter terrae]KAB1638354.1 PhzF family phenazine biosynthesis protein [Pseudoclavibacter terrae]
MSSTLRYAAFTTDPDGGNPAGIVLDALELDPRERQHIAAELGYSETAFVEPGPRAREYKIRYFSPVAEVPFCGHATIASAVALADREGPGDIVLETSAGRVDVATERVDGSIRAAMTSVDTRSHPADESLVAAALAALDWRKGELNTDFPPHVSFGGVNHLVLTVSTRERLAELEYNFENLKRIMSFNDLTTLQLVYVDGAGEVVHSRNPFPVGGIVEDSATGAAAAAYGGYLRALGRVTARRSFTILQGEDMGRPSQLTVTVDPNSARVTVAGHAVEILTP